MKLQNKKIGQIVSNIFGTFFTTFKTLTLLLLLVAVLALSLYALFNVAVYALLPVTLIATDFFAITTLLSFVVCLKDKKYSPLFNCFSGTK